VIGGYEYRGSAHACTVAVAFSGRPTCA
jgi:hypothetical protein